MTKRRLKFMHLGKQQEDRIRRLPRKVLVEEYLRLRRVLAETNNIFIRKWTLWILERQFKPIRRSR